MFDGTRSKRFSNLRLGVVVTVWSIGMTLAATASTAGATQPTMSYAGTRHLAVRPFGLATLRGTLHDPGANSGDDFGAPVAVQGSTAVVGAEGTSSYAGAAYIYVKGTSVWPTTPTAALSDPTATAGDEFGASVAVSGTIAVVGAPGAGTNGCDGAAYIYMKDASGWPTTPTATLSDPAATVAKARVGFSDNGSLIPPPCDDFGTSVAVSGTTAVVGAPGTNGYDGAAYIFMNGGSGWPTTPTAKLKDPNAGEGDGFGYSVALSGTTTLVSAYGANSYDGAAYIYVKGTSGWPKKPTATLDDPAATTYDFFGWSVAMSNTTAVVGARGTSSGAGAAYIYVKGTSEWPTTPTTKLKDPDAREGDRFSYSVAVSGTTALVSTYGANSAAGVAYVYVKGASGWPTTPTTKLKDPDATEGDGFGYSVAVSGTTAVVGAAGAAYIYIKGTSGWPKKPTTTLEDP